MSLRRGEEGMRVHLLLSLQASLTTSDKQEVGLVLFDASEFSCSL
jgi:hypothetical protein